LDVEHPDRVETFVTGVRNLVDLRFSPDGSLYVLSRNAWVIDDKFSPRTGSLLRIRPVGEFATGDAAPDDD
jgi:sugar lactone lactonase YvrE